MSEQVTPNTQQVEDVEKARFMAYAEKPSRNMAVLSNGRAEERLITVVEASQNPGHPKAGEASIYAKSAVQFAEHADEHTATALKIGEMAGKLYDKQ